MTFGLGRATQCTPRYRYFGAGNDLVDRTPISRLDFRLANELRPAGGTLDALVNEGEDFAVAIQQQSAAVLSITSATKLA